MEDHETVRCREYTAKPTTVEERLENIRELFYELDGEGYREVCRSLLEELTLGLCLAAIIGEKKSAFRARKEKDWDTILDGIYSTSSPAELEAWAAKNVQVLATLPRGWDEHVRDEYERHMATLKDMIP
jgi:hypothetical protein